MASTIAPPILPRPTKPTLRSLVLTSNPPQLGYGRRPPPRPLCPTPARRRRRAVSQPLRPATTRQCPLCYERIGGLTSPCSIAHDESLGDEDYALNDPDQLRPIFMVSYRVRYEVTHGHAFLLSL